MSRGGFRGGRGRGRGGRADLPFGHLTGLDLANTAKESARASELLLFDPSVELPETAEADEHERQEGEWADRLALGNGHGRSGDIRGGKFWAGIPPTTTEKAKAKGGEGEPWLYSERYRTVEAPSTSRPRLPLLHDRPDRRFYPPDLWAGYFEGKPERKRHRLPNGTADGTTDDEAVHAKKKPRAEILDQLERDGQNKPTAPAHDEDAQEPRDEEEDEEDDPDYDNNYFDNGEDDELGSEGGGDDGGTFD